MAGSSSNWFKMTTGPLKGQRVFVSNATLSSKFTNPQGVGKTKANFAAQIAKGNPDANAQIRNLAKKSPQPKGQAQKGGAIQARLKLGGSSAAPVVNGQSLATMSKYEMVKNRHAIIQALPKRYRDQLQAEYKAHIENWVKNNLPPLYQGATSLKIGAADKQNKAYSKKLAKLQEESELMVVDKIYAKYHVES